MSAAIVVVILVAAGEAHAPATESLTAAATEALGPRASFVIREVPVLFDGKALSEEDQMLAAAVAQVQWSGKNRTRVRLRLHSARSDRWIERELTFLPQDSPKERGRTLGFALASMLISQGDSPQSPARTPAPDRAPAPPPVLDRADRSRSGDTSTSGGETSVRRQDDSDVGFRAQSRSSPVSDLAEERNEAPPTSPPRRQIVRPSAPPEKRLALGMTVAGAMGLGGPAGGVGGGVDIEYFAGADFWLRAASTFRTGYLSGLNFTQLVGTAMAGAMWRPYLPTAAQPFGIGAGLQVGAVFHNLSHVAAEGSATQHRRRYLPGASFLIEASAHVSRRWDVIAELALEAAFGVTEVGVQRLPPEMDLVQMVATVPVLRAVALAGFRWHF